MPCLPILNSRGNKRIGFLCVDNEPVELRYKEKIYRVEWTAACGWLAVNRDGTERVSPLPKAVWDMVDKLEWPSAKEKA